MEINEELKAVKDLIQAFLKSKKILKIYPHNNPIYIKTLEDCYGKFQNFTHYKDNLNLKFKQNEIYCDSEQVYSNPEKEDNLALFFFKDGLREITFKKGLTHDELEEFLKIISLDFDREIIDDDIVTLLWERDFQNIQYVVDEAFLSDEEDYEANAVSAAKDDETEQNDLMMAYKDAFNEESNLHEISIIPLNDKDLQMLFKELEMDFHDKTGKLIDILFEMIHMVENENNYSDLNSFFMNVIDFSLRHGDIQILTTVLSKFRQLIDNNNVDGEEVKKHIKKIIYFCGSEKIINSIGEIFDSGQEIEEKHFEKYVKLLEKNSIPSFMKILGELKSIHARKMVIDALIFWGPKDIVALSKGLNDTRWYVVRNIIYVLRKIGDKRAVDYLLKTVKHGDIRVKKEVIKTLGELGGAGVLMTLRDCLDDTDKQVRSASMKALGNIGSESTKRIILDKITNKYFKDKDPEEKKEYFEVLSRWKDADVYNFLVRIIRKRIFFKRTKNYENKACVAYCLGLIGNKDALPILNKYKNSNNRMLKEFSYTAIKRIEHGQ